MSLTEYKPADRSELFLNSKSAKKKNLRRQKKCY